MTAGPGISSSPGENEGVFLQKMLPLIRDATICYGCRGSDLRGQE